MYIDYINIYFFIGDTISLVAAYITSILKTDILLNMIVISYFLDLKINVILGKMFVIIYVLSEKYIYKNDIYLFFKFIIDGIDYCINNMVNFDIMKKNYSTVVLNDSFIFNNKFCNINLMNKYPEFFTSFSEFMDNILYISTIILLLLTFIYIFFTKYKINYNFDFINNYVYSIYSKLIESEKELFSIEDVLLFTILFVIFYCWFFILYFLPNSLQYSEAVFCLSCIPVVVIIILSMPFFLLIDFGYNYIQNLKGSANVTLLTLEFLFDCLALFIMFIRLFVQHIRFLIMFIGFAEIQEYFILYTLQTDNLIMSDSFMDDLNDFRFTFSNTCYFIFAILPTRIIHLTYTILHLYFIITAHFFAFLMLVFWLFFFLYTCFYKKKPEITVDEFKEMKERQLKLLNKFKVN